MQFKQCVTLTKHKRTLEKINASQEMFATIGHFYKLQQLSLKLKIQKILSNVQV